MPYYEKQHLFNASRSYDIVRTDVVRSIFVIIEGSKDKMLLFGHPGITLGAAALLANTLRGNRLSRTTRNEATEPSFQSVPTQSSHVNSKASWFSAMGTRIDIRLLIVGSLLPDIIDKPLGFWLFRESLSSGRIFAHTLLFFFLITLAGFYLYKNYERTSLLALSFGTFTHLVFDQMWRGPRTLLWPLYGFTFPRGNTTDWIPNMLRALMTDPRLYVPELVGFVILAWFTLTLVRERKVTYFLRWGRVR